jgi:hypothetical protein
VVQWLRRLTLTELADAQNLEQYRRDQQALLADPEQPPPDAGPLPGGADFTRPVHACAQHAIGIDAAALIHQGTCTAPNPATLPGCDCTPEQPAPAPPPVSGPELPASWIA